MNVSIRQLQGFISVARFGSFTRAAEHMYITQAGLSAMIKDLEEQLQFRLFDRTTRSVTLTRAGANFIGPAERVVEETLSAVTRIQTEVAQERQILTVAVTPIVAASLFPHVNAAFAKIEPSVQIKICDVPQRQIQPLVESGEADVGFSIYRKSSTGIKTRELLRFQLLYIAPRGALYSTPQSKPALADIAWHDIPDMPLIALPSDLPLQQSIDASINKSAKKFPARIICNSMQTIIAMVSAGHGAALLPSMVKPLCAPNQFDVARIRDQATSLPFYQISKQGRQLPDSLDPFVATFFHTASELCSI